ncbi:MAG TPA: NAD(P)H-binding protein [Gemmatimonadaceae bacterium]|nr:NAD(P)H-binding protein [Gemmatimonadaceae bacterium]
MTGGAGASPPGRRVLLAGATGLVGSELLRRLLADPSVARVVAIARRPLGERSGRLEPRIVDFEHLDQARDAFAVEQVFCALGTTIRQAGSRERFRRVDFDYAVEIGRLAREQGARHYLLVSAVGATATSRIFYNRVKGELEDAVRGLGYPSLTIARPSLLLGDRGEWRMGEEIGKWLGWLLPGRLRPVEASDVAAALVDAARADAPGMRIIESEEIRRRARARPADESR